MSAIHPTQRALVEAAIALVAEGHQAPRMKDVAARAGVVPSAAYRYCASVDDLLRAAFLERYEALAGAIDAIPGEGPEAIDALVALVCARHDAAPAETAFLLRAQHGALAAVSPAQNPVAAVGRLLARGQAAGWIRPDPEPVLLALVVGPLVQAATLAHYRALPALSALAGPIADGIRRSVAP